MDFAALPGARTRNFKKGDILIGQGEVVDDLYYLVNGVVYRNVLTERGMETTLTIKKTTATSEIECLIGVLVLYKEGRVSSGSFIAKTDCTCIRIPYKAFMQEARKDPDILEQILYFSLKNYMSLLEMYQIKQEGDTVSKLCNLLLANSSEKNGRLICSAKLPNADLADRLGVHPVTVSRIMSKLKEEKIIAKDKNGLEILDEAYMRGIASHEISLSYRYKEKE